MEEKYIVAVADFHAINAAISMFEREVLPRVRHCPIQLVERRSVDVFLGAHPNHSILHRHLSALPQAYHTNLDCAAITIVTIELLVMGWSQLWVERRHYSKNS